MSNPSPLQQKADRAKAALGISTRLQSMLLPNQQAQQTAQNANPAPTGPSNQNTATDTASQMQGLESRIFDEIGTLRQEIQQVDAKNSGKDLQELKTQIEQILAQTD